MAARTTVIVLNWNGRDLLDECLTSLREQTDRDAAILLVDNGSTDGSVALVRACFPEVGVLALPENYGFAKGNNLGIQQVSTGRIALLNNDTRADPRWLERLNAALDEHADAGFCASKLLDYHHRTTLDAAGDVLGVARAFKRGHGKQDGPRYAARRYVFGACAAAALYRRTMLDQIGLFDESFGTNCEDVDLSFRAQLAGWRCLYVPDAIVYHRMGETKRRIRFRHAVTYRNAKNAWLKNAPTALLFKYAPRLIRDEGFRVLVAAGIRRGGFGKLDFDRLAALLLADAQVLARLPDTLRKRRSIQRRRVVSAAYIESLMRGRGRGPT